MSKDVIILGGDKRMEYLGHYLKDAGYKVKSMINDFCPDHLKKAQSLILPIPASRDGKTLYAPFINESILLDEVLDAFGGDKVFGGKLPKKDYVFQVTDYGEKEEFMMYNAISTAEGAIELLIKNTDYTLCSSQILVLGWGRIGKVLCSMLKGMGAIPTATARKEKDIASITAMGIRAENSYDIRHILKDYPLIVNTVPHKLIGDEDYEFIQNGTFIMDLASMPGYINKELCDQRGIKTCHALSLPGKVAPKSAGYAIYRAIKDYM